MPRMFHSTDGKQNSAGPVNVFVIRSVKDAATSMNCEPVVVRTFDSNNLFTRGDVQVVIQHEVNVVRQQFFTSWFFPDWPERTFTHLEFIGRGKHLASDRILPNRVGDGSFFDDQIGQAFAGRGVSGGQSGWSRADDYKIEWIRHKQFIGHLKGLKIPTRPWLLPRTVRRHGLLRLCRAHLSLPTRAGWVV